MDLEAILQTLDSIAIGAEVLPAALPIAAAADYFLKIAAAAARAHKTVTGEPLDLSKLHHIETV